MTDYTCKYPHARKEHRCDWCCGTIEKGEQYCNCTIFDGTPAHICLHMECQYCDSEYKKLIDMDQDEGVTSWGIRGKPWTTEEEREMKDKVTDPRYSPYCPWCMISAWWDVKMPKPGKELVAHCPVCDRNFFVEMMNNYSVRYKKISRVEECLSPPPMSPELMVLAEGMMGEVKNA